MSRVETSAWLALAGALGLGYVFAEGGPRLANDSYQYLSIAGNILSGNGISTSLVHFTSERALGVVPAPVTTFPPGYPVVLAAFQFLGIGAEVAALLVSLLATCTTAWCLSAAGRVLGLSRFATRIVVAGWIANSWTAFYAYSVLSESLFTCLTVLALLTFVVSERDDTEPKTALRAGIVTHLCVGAAVWLRYAGLFLLGAVVLYHVTRRVRTGQFAPVRRLATIGISVTMASAVLIRNVVLVGTWHGTMEMAPEPDLGSIARNLGRALHDVILGGPVPVRVGLLEVLAALGVILAGGAVVARNRSSPKPLPQTSRRAPEHILTMTVLAVGAGTLYLGLSGHHFDHRIIYPFLAPALLLAGLVITRFTAFLSGRPLMVFKGGLGLSLAAYIAINIQDYVPLLDWSADFAPHTQAEARLAQPTETGEALSAWLNRTLPENATLIANDAQAVGYVLHRPTVSIDPPMFDEPLTAANLSALMQTYDAPGVIITLSGGLADEDRLSTSPFIDNLRSGRLPPGLVVGATTASVVVLTRTPS